MKKVTYLLILMSVFVFKSKATVFPVIYGPSFVDSVTCYAGDTVRFQLPQNAVVQIALLLNDGGALFMNQSGNATPTYTTVATDANGLSLDYIVQGNELKYQMNGSIGVFTILTNTNVATGITTTGVDDADIKVFPNPAMNELLVRTPAAGTLNIFAANGQLLMASPISAGENRLNIESLPSGIYFVTIGNRSIRILKQ